MYMHRKTKYKTAELLKLQSASARLTEIMPLNSPSQTFPTGPQLSCTMYLKTHHGAYRILLTCYRVLPRLPSACCGGCSSGTHTDCFFLMFGLFLLWCKVHQKHIVKQDGSSRVLFYPAFAGETAFFL